jgi:DNA (cytosine-5)-methyltransferase 1
MAKSPNYSLPIKVFDFFSGCGGASKGFEQAGLDPVFALDNYTYAAKSFENNFSGTKIFNTTNFGKKIPKTTFLLESIENVLPKALKPIIDKCSGSPLLFAGCAPCQPFSRQKTIRPKQDDRKALLDYFRIFVEYFQPEFVFVENVPGIQKVSVNDGGPFDNFIQTLEEKKYFYKYAVVQAQNYGVPQKRKRLILIASRLGNIDFPPETHGPGTSNPNYSTPREWMDGFTPLKAGEVDQLDSNHRAANLSALNLRRLKATPVDGDRLTWSKDLRLACHTNGYKGHTDVYGRIKWDELANCLTTKCTSLSNGRFGHPEEDRAITPREAACLQTFPRDFKFDGGVTIASRQIGNAVPVLLTKKFGEQFNNHLKEFIKGKLNGEI